ncbi:hypothetical protein [Pseudomonas moraviensis]
MTSNNIWFEVDKSNGAIMSYCLKLPTTLSSTCNYIEATKDELLYLSALEDAIFAPGTVATLSDLEAHRTRVAAAKKVKEILTAKAVYKAAQQPSKGDSKPSDSNPKTDNGNTKASLVKALRKHRSRK